MYHVFTRENEKTENNPFTYAQKSSAHEDKCLL